jgi:hypothetical protein
MLMLMPMLMLMKQTDAEVEGRSTGGCRLPLHSASDISLNRFHQHRPPHQHQHSRFAEAE